MGLIPELERSPGEGNGYPLQYSCLENSMDRGALQYSCLENSMDRGALQATVHVNLKGLEMTEHTHTNTQEVLEPVRTISYTSLPSW